MIPTPANTLEKIYNGLCCLSGKPASRSIELCVDTSTPESAVKAVQTTLFDAYTGETQSIVYHDMEGNDITDIVVQVVDCI